MSIIATWRIGLPAVEIASKIVENGGTALKAMQAGITHVEDDTSLGPRNVGRGNFPNVEGFPQYDAGVMLGNSNKMGAVFALEHCPNAFNVACTVLEKSRHSALSGDGVTKFAERNGFLMESHESLLSETPPKKIESEDHDTISMIILDQNGDIVSGSSTSGISNKEVGRVGDSPLPGCGYYADNCYGAAAATGDGDIIMQFCPSFHIVCLMRYQAKSPQLACETVAIEMLQKHKTHFDFGLIAMDTKGNFGATCSFEKSKGCDGKFHPGFIVAMWNLGWKQPETKYFPTVQIPNFN